MRGSGRIRDLRHSPSLQPGPELGGQLRLIDVQLTHHLFEGDGLRFGVDDVCSTHELSVDAALPPVLRAKRSRG